MTTPLEALAFLARQDPTPEYFSAFHLEVNAENNHRAAAILLAANTEISLRYAIKSHLVVTGESETTLFHGGSPLRSFEAKIRIGYTMGLYREETKSNLDCIKGIRNAFAHAVIPITFNTPQVKAVCDLMVMPEISYPRAINANTGEPVGLLPALAPPRQKFQRIAEAVSHNLFWLGWSTSLGTTSDPPPERAQAKERWKPLP
jgi:hypothetical protein